MPAKHVVPDEITGKTVRGVIEGGVEETVLIVFTDGTYLRLQARPSYSGEAELETTEDVKIQDYAFPEERRNRAVEVGLFSPEDFAKYDWWLEASRVARAAEEETRSYRQYQELKRRFES